MTRVRPMVYQGVLWVVAMAVIAFLLFPLVVVIPESFSPTTILYFPPHGLSLRWYQDFVNDPNWIPALWLSVRLGLSVAALATILGLAAAVGLHRYIKRGRGAIRLLVVGPVIIPVIVSAIAIFDIMSRLRLVGTFEGLLLAHTILAVPFPIIILENALKSVDPTLEDAAVSMGASRLQAFYKVTLRLILPSVFGAALFAFMASWDEVVVVLFVGGAFLQTLPLVMYQFVTTEIKPTIGAVSTLLIVAVAIVFAIAQTRPWRRVQWLTRR